jgi:Chlorophyll A-B binding protein
MPFLPYPKNLKGYIGDDIGFDPLRISDYFPMDYLRESELKHGRICMLAAVGYITVDLGVIIHPLGSGLSSAAAHEAMTANGVMGNMLVFLGLAEMVGYIGVAEMLQGSGRAPGDFGFGTKFLEGKSAEQIKKLKYQEIMVSFQLFFGLFVSKGFLFSGRLISHTYLPLTTLYRTDAWPCWRLVEW